MLENLLAIEHRIRLKIADRFPFLIPKKRGGVHHLLLTIALVCLALWLRLAIAPVEAGIPYVTFFPAVTLAAIAGGFSAGMFATLMGLVLSTYIFTPPYYSFSIEALHTAFWSNMVFLMDGVIVSASIEAMHRYRLQLAEALKQSTQTHAALADSTQYLTKILDNLFAYVALLDSEGVVQEVNKAAFERCGYRREDVIGRYFYDAPCWRYDETVRAQLINAIQAAKQGQTLRYDVTVKMGDELVPVDFQISPVRGQNGGIIGLLPTGVDISLRKQAEERLKKSKAQLRTFINHAPISMAMFDRQMNYLACSGRWQEEYNRGYSDLIGRNHYQVHPDLPEKWKWVNQQGMAGVNLRNDEDLWIQADGGKHWLRWSVSPWNDETGAIGGVIIAAEDITDRKRNEAQLAEQAQQLGEANRRKDEFLAMLAHELRNPLAPIRNAVEILKLTDSDPARIGWCSDIIDHQVEHLIRLVDDLLDVSRISRGQVELKKEPLEIRDFIQPALETSQPLIDARRQTFHLALPPEPLWVEGDRVRLAQVISNLINNAAKYTQIGGQLGLSTELDGDKICIHVHDNGCGIAPADLPRLFDLFYQTDRDLDRSQGGLGIGLSLVHSLVAKHGGDVQVFSAGLDQGSEFVVRLPQLIHPDALPGFSASPAAPALKRRILVVDDNRDAAQSLGLLLEIDGHYVRTAINAKTALEMARYEQPDVIVLDIGLPDMDGYAVAQTLRRGYGLDRTLLIALTGYGQPDDREKALAAGFDEHLVKPVKIETLRKLLSKYQITSLPGPV